ncbi:MAG: DUF4157 domain-containing protein [Chitinophagaceae bacterium]|nr:DUF4157 domain-containing protein [Chitinophagaceae bacterium]
MGYLSKSSDKAKASQNNALGQVDGVPIQAKMRYGEPGDSYEQEADRVADAVVANTSSKTSSNASGSPALGSGISNYVQREAEPKAGGEEEKKQEEQPAQKKEEKKDEEKTAQKKEDKKEEEKPAQKKEGKKEEEKPAQKKEGKKEEEKPAQKKEGKKEEEKPAQKKEGKKEEEKPAQKKEGKMEEEKPAQKKEGKKEEEKPAQKKEGKKEEEKPAQKKEGKKEEEKPAQKKEANKEEEKPAQKKSTDKKEEDKKVQKKEAKKEEEKPAQKKESDNPKAEEPDIEKDIIASKNAGKPMEDDVRKEMEKQFSKDFKNVRIHNDGASYEMCRKINAQAFTHGSHVYFGEGKYNPQSTEGKRLLAHELTHVVQQGNEVKRKMVQKAGNTTAPAASATDFEEAGVGKIKKDSSGKVNHVELDHVKVPEFKKQANSVTTIPKKREKPTDQKEKWINEVTLNSDVATQLDTMMATALSTYKDLKDTLKSNGMYFLKRKGKGGKDMASYIMGTKTEVLARLKRPNWKKDGSTFFFDVDHRHEFQLGGPHDLTNFWLLDSKANQESGRNIDREMNKDLTTLGTKAAKTIGAVPDSRSLLKDNDIKLTNGVKGGLSPTSNDVVAYEEADVKKGEMLKGVEFLSEKEIIEKNLTGSKNQLVIYPSPSGGAKIDVKWDEGKKGSPVAVGKKFGNLKINTVTYNGPGGGNSVNITLFENFKKNLKSTPTLDVDLGQSGGIAYGGVLSKQSIYTKLKANPPAIPHASPISIDSVELTDEGLEARGKLLPSVEIIRKADIDVIINSQGIYLSKTFSIEEVKVPPPLKISNCSVTFMLGAGESNLMAEGVVDFSITGLGEGSIKASGSENGFSLVGELKLDEKIFDGSIKAEYHKKGDSESWKITGTANLKKMTGIKGGKINVEYDGSKLSAKGDVDLDIKGVEKGSLEAVVGEDTLMIKGKFTLAKLPGISSGEGEAMLEKGPDGEYKVKLSGKAKPAIKGLDTEISVEYDNGTLTVKGTVSYNKGIVSGSVNVAVTNGPPPGDTPNAGAGGEGDFRIYGGGELTVKITPWLQGTLGVQFDEKNELIITGKIGIPSPIDVFPKKEIPEKDLFSMGVDIPIFAIPLGPKSIGLKARIEGALKAYAGIGPGKLENLELGITFNPDNPDATHITGKGRFAIPAEAGVKLAVRASIGVDAGVAGVEGGIEVAGGLGLKAEASADITVDWTPTTGLELKANLNADVQPKFIFNIDGFIKAWLLFYEDEWRYRFANYEYGSNLNFGVTLPIHYKEGEPFDVNFEDIEFRKPDVDAESFVGGLIKDLA